MTGKYERNWQFYDRHKAGERFVDIAREAGLTRTRVREIVMKCQRHIGYAKREDQRPFVEERKDWPNIAARLK